MLLPLELDPSPPKKWVAWLDVTRCKARKSGKKLA
jgi:hypothetical protein